MTPAERARRRALWEASVVRGDPYTAAIALLDTEGGEWVTYTPADLGVGVAPTVPRLRIVPTDGRE